MTLSSIREKFGHPAQLKRADISEIAQTPNVGRKKAVAIKQALKPFSNDSRNGFATATDGGDSSE